MSRMAQRAGGGRLACLMALVLLSSACGRDHRNDPPPNPIQTKPAAPDLHKAAQIYTQLGMQYARQGNLDLAMARLKKALEEDDGYAPAHAAIAYVYALRRDPDTAEAQFRRAIELDRKNPDIQNNFGVFLCSHGKPDEGEKYFILAAQNPDYSTPAAAWTNAGICARQTKDAKRAESDFRLALETNPDFPDALAQMAQITFEQQDYLRTRAFLQRYQGERGADGNPVAFTPELLELGAATEHALGNQSAARDFELKLIREYPESEQAAKLTRRSAP
jgi:type IV pilus assembly protein PilF